MTTRTHRMIVGLAWVALLVILSSAGVLAVQADHVCIGDDCSVCCLLDVCEQILHAGVLSVVTVWLCLFLLSVTVTSICATRGGSVTTPVSLKTKLSE